MVLLIWFSNQMGALSTLKSLSREDISHDLLVRPQSQFGFISLCSIFITLHLVGLILSTICLTNPKA